MLYLIDPPSARESIGRPLRRSRAPICDDLVLEALRPLDVLQIGCPGQVLDDGDGNRVPSVGSLHEAIALVAQHEFDAIVLGPKVADAWPTAAYEQIANLAGTTTVVVQTDYLGPMTTIKQRHGREQDVIVANAEPSLLARLILAAILRRRALAEQPGAQIG